MNQRLPTAGSGRVPGPVRALLIAAIGYGAACTSLPPEIGVEEEQPPVVVESVPEPEPDVHAVPEPEPVVEEPVAAVTAPSRVVVFRSGDATSYAAVSDALDASLRGRYEIEHVDYADLDAAALEELDRSAAVAGIAIGLDAARFAATRLTLPTVVCQIYDLDPLIGQHDQLFGVAALPPAKLQLQAWKRLAPDVETVGLFVSEGETRTVAAARQAAKEVGVRLLVEFAASDRELLYRFKRIAPQLDGLWLVPDNDILSPPVLRELFSYAAVHRVHSIVFNPSLLSWGALLSVSSSTPNVAATVAGVLDAIVAGRTADLPRISALTAVDTKINDDVARSLGFGNAANLPARSEVALK